MIHITPRAILRTAVWVALLWLNGCSGVQPAPIQDVCAELAKGDEAFIEAKAAELGLPVAVLHDIYVAVCGPLSSDRGQAQTAARDAVSHARDYMMTDAGAPLRKIP